MAEGIIYLRPSADISVGHAIYPSSLPHGYLAINEVESDDSSTYIYQTVTNGSSSRAESQFALSGDYSNVGSILGGRIFVDGFNSLTVSCNMDISLIIGGTEYSIINSYLFNDNATFDLPETCIAAMSNVNSLSNIQFKFQSMATTSAGKSTDYYFTQIYLELTVDYLNTDIGIHKKVNGEWKAATAAYKKANGAWAEISADECKECLASAFVTT